MGIAASLPGMRYTFRNVPSNESNRTNAAYDRITDTLSSMSSMDYRFPYPSPFPSENQKGAVNTKIVSNLYETVNCDAQDGTAFRHQFRRDSQHTARYRVLT